MGWEDVATKPKNGEDQAEKVKYNKLVSGKTHAGRILDDAPFSRYTHWIPQANEGKGLTVDCPGSGCPICDDIRKKKKTGEKQKYSSRKLHAINWLNRETNEVEVLDKGKGLFEALSGLLSEVGDLREYDVKIKVTGEGTDTNYTPIPMPPKKLTEAEKSMQKYDLDKVSIKVTNEQLQMLMNGASLSDVFGDKTTDETTDADNSEESPEVDFTK